MTVTNPYRPEAYDYFYTRLPFGSDEVFERAVQPGIAEAEQEFGIRFQELDRGELPIASELGRTAYVLASSMEFYMDSIKGSRALLATDIGRRALNYLLYLGNEYGAAEQRGAPVKLTIPTAFSVDLSMRGAPRNPRRELIQLRRQGASRWNIDIPVISDSLRASMPYADTLSTEADTLRNSQADIADNIRCETFRLAYRDERDNSPEALQALRAAQVEARSTARHIGMLFQMHMLWHRAPTDGAIFIKTEHGWLVSQTGACKDLITERNFSLIRRMDAASNTIVSTGSHPPSSDTPELLMALEGVGDDANIGVHYHSNGLTRVSKNRMVKAHRTEDVIRYGRFASAPQVVTAFETIADNWLILKEHGVFWMGKSAADFDAFTASKTIRKAHSTLT